MSRVNNFVSVSGKVIFGPKPLKNSSGVNKVRFQIEIPPRQNKNAMVFRPFIVAYGTLADRVLKELKPGEPVQVSGKILTHSVEETNFYKVKKEDSSKIEQVDMAALNDDDDDDDEIVLYQLTETKIKTEIQADDIKYWADILSELTQEELKNAFGMKKLTRALEIKEQREKQEKMIYEQGNNEL